jgi:pimeloyl-ACP methyl ester carboxylesterase
MIPFQQVPLRDLPERPRLPHPFFDMPSHELTLRSAPFGSHRVHVRTWGSGPPLLLIHGLMTSSYSWRYTLEALGHHAKLIVPDLVGHGRTDAPPGRYSIEALSTWIGELQLAMGLRGAPAIANSMGGTIALQRAVRDPGAFSRLVVVHSPVCPIPRLHLLHAVMSCPGSRALLGALIRRDPLAWAHHNVHYYDESLKSLEEAREYAAPLRRPEGVTALASLLRDGLAPRELRRLLGELRDRPPQTPMQLVYATTDPLVPPATAARLHALFPGAHLARLEQASHFAHVDAADRFTATVLPFLEGKGGT